MAHVAHYPSNPPLYPIGIASAVLLTETLAPEESANLLLLGCGDQIHNILFTIYNEADHAQRTLDFTCCDVEPTILARDILLLTMIMDNELSDAILSKIWDTFFHFFLDEESHTFLIKQCETLIGVSGSITAWSSSKYAKIIRMCNVNTLVELRRHWELYFRADKLSSAGRKRRKEMVLSHIRSTGSTTHGSSCHVPCRSAGPYFVQYKEPLGDVHRHYWTTGITSTDPRVVAAATLVNPTFIYSLTGEGFALHYATVPISPFHLAPSFLTSKQNTPTITELADCAKSQFSGWVKHFRVFIQDKPGKLTIRLFAGDAISLCWALAHHSDTGKIPANLTVAPWNTTPLVLDGGDYDFNQGAPTSFNVVETSNTMDYIGLFNVLIATLLILSPVPSATLFTEALQYCGEDVTEGVEKKFCADLSTISLLLGLVPINYFSNFNTRSNAEEILATEFGLNYPKKFHERITWKRPTPGDPNVASQLQDSSGIPVSFEPFDLGKTLFDIYGKMFAPEDLVASTSPSARKSPREWEVVHYSREAFAILLAIVKRRVNVDWDSTMVSLFNQWHNGGLTIPVGMASYNDLCSHLYLMGVCTPGLICTPVPKVGRFREWAHIPPIISVILVVPRENLRVVSEVVPGKVDSPVLHGTLHGRIAHHVFASLKMGFGKVTASGTDSHPKVVFEPDPSSWSGTSPLIVSFSAPSRALHIEHPDVMRVVLSFNTTPLTAVTLSPKLGTLLSVFSAPVMDRSHVFVVPDKPRGLDRFFDKIFTKTRQANHVSVTMDPAGSRVATLTARADITDGPTKNVLSSGVEVASRQLSPCTMEIGIDRSKKSLVYPLPVIGSRSKLRIARKSSYVEVVAPVAGPLRPDGFALNRFPILLTDKVEAPWNLHRLQLDRLPILDVSNPSRVGWIISHLGLTMTDRECALREREDRTDTLANIKSTIHVILNNATGVQPRPRVFGLGTKWTLDTIVFVPALRFDLASHTLVADAYLLPLIPSRRSMIAETLLTIMSKMVLIEPWGDEIKGWKRLLPALAERCRAWEHGPNCEYLAKRLIPLSLELGEDPLCSCGQGKDVSAAFAQEKEWESVIPFVTRIAIGPLFGVPYIESVGCSAGGARRETDKGRKETMKMCARCGDQGKPKLLVCSACKGARYCSAECQKDDWKKHKEFCRAAREPRPD